MMQTWQAEGHVVKKSQYIEEQIAFALKQAGLGTPVAKVCRKMGISDTTCYNWRHKYGGWARRRYAG